MQNVYGENVLGDNVVGGNIVRKPFHPPLPGGNKYRPGIML